MMTLYFSEKVLLIKKGYDAINTFDLIWINRQISIKKCSCGQL